MDRERFTKRNRFVDAHIPAGSSQPLPREVSDMDNTLSDFGSWQHSQKDPATQKDWAARFKSS